MSSSSKRRSRKNKKWQPSSNNISLKTSNADQKSSKPIPKKLPQLNNPIKSDQQHPPFQKLSKIEVANLKIGDDVDIMDNMGKWFCTKIRDVNREREKFWLQFLRFDDCIKWFSYKDHSKFAKGHSISSRQSHRMQQLDEGDWIDVIPPQATDVWVAAEIMVVDTLSGQVKVKYELPVNDIEYKTYKYWFHLDDESNVAEEGTKVDCSETFAFDSFDSKPPKKTKTQKYESKIEESKKETKETPKKTTTKKIVKDDHPPHYICPITYEIMKDPVISTVSGQTYEREDIEQHIKTYGTDPLTNQHLRIDQLVPNRALREAIELYKKTLQKFDK